MIRYTGFQFCPRCGGRDIRDRDGKAVFCGDCGFLYFHNAASAVAGIIETAGGIVLVRRKVDPGTGMLDFPGGFVDYGESFESALLREIREELNLELHDLQYFGSFPNTYVFGDVTYFTSDVVFVCSADAGTGITPNGEIAEVVIVRPEEADAGLMAFESAKAVLMKYREQRKSIDH
jgi:NADH pyrophosphatase NudC (nudix superfamily)